MQIEHTKHALSRYRRRKISPELIKEAIIRGQERKYQTHGTIKCIYRKDNKKLVVVYKQNRAKYKIITTYYED